MKEIDRYLEERVYLLDIAGLCASVGRGGENLLKAYGHADMEKCIPMTTEHIMHCASITKLVTLDIASHFDLSLKAADILKDCGIDERITLEMLAGHTSGIGDVMKYAWEGGRRPSRMPMIGIPGERYIYSSLGYDILGECMEALSGKPFEILAHELVFKPAGMMCSTMMSPEMIDDRLLAKPHVKDESKNLVKSIIYPYAPEHVPSSCMKAPIGDLAALADYFMMRDEEVYKRWQMRIVSGKTVYGHDGSDVGFWSSFWICPEEGIHVVLLANSDNASLKSLSNHIIDELISLEEKGKME